MNQPQPALAAKRPDTHRRFAALDGLRGVAIILVMLFHDYVRWPALVPYGDRFSTLPVIAHGRVGVQLFFLISGFVIFMTLDRSSSYANFMKRRWLRLWPAMLVASVLLFATAPWFNRPQGLPTLRDLLPGLTFVEPRWWSFLSGTPQGLLEGAFWTLFVEMKFYVFVGAVYFGAGPRTALAALIAVYLAPSALGRIHALAPTIVDVGDFLSSWHWGWFAAGALYYKSTTRRWLLVPAFALSLFAASRMEHELVPAAMGIAVLFAVTMVSAHAQRMLSTPLLLFLGAISYPLYLVHENLMLSLIGTMGHDMPGLPAALMPLPPMLAVIVIGWTIARHVEPPARKAIEAFVERLRRRPSPA